MSRVVEKAAIEDCIEYLEDILDQKTRENKWLPLSPTERLHFHYPGESVLKTKLQYILAVMYEMEEASDGRHEKST